MYKKIATETTPFTGNGARINRFLFPWLEQRTGTNDANKIFVLNPPRVEELRQELPAEVQGRIGPNHLRHARRETADERARRTVAETVSGLRLTPAQWESFLHIRNCKGGVAGGGVVETARLAGNDGAD